MKKTLLIAGMIAAPISMAVAKTINFDTPIEWNSKVIEQALNKAGFIGDSGANWDVRVTHDRILTELLNRKSFSLKDATQVCLNKCNMSDFLKNGRGSSGKKCPELCNEFMKTILVENNKQTSMPSANGQSSAFSNLQGKAIDVCRRLMSDAQKSGMSYPVLCGGKCARWLGQDDAVTITDLVQTKEYKVDDFCNNDEKGRDYYYIMDQSGGAQDVSKVEQSQRILKLREIQTQSAKDYISQKEKQAKDKAAQDYAKRVASNGYCKEVIVLDWTGAEWDWINSQGGLGEICKKHARKWAQSHACKLKSFVGLNVQNEVVECIANGVGEYHNGSTNFGNNSQLVDKEADYSEKLQASTASSTYEYVPSYSDCVATFNEQDCANISQGHYK